MGLDLGCTEDWKMNGNQLTKIVCVCARTGSVDDMYLMDQDDPSQCQALESSLWEIKVR